MHNDIFASRMLQLVTVVNQTLLQLVVQHINRLSEIRS